MQNFLLLNHVLFVRNRYYQSFQEIPALGFDEGSSVSFHLFDSLNIQF